MNAGQKKLKRIRSQKEVVLIVLFNLYPLQVSSVVLFAFLFNKTALSLYLQILNILLLYCSFGLGLDALVNRITLTLQIINSFQLDLFELQQKEWEVGLKAPSRIIQVASELSLGIPFD